METASQRAIKLAADVFEENLVFSFIGGSRARGSAKPQSDVDIFVVLAEPDRIREVDFADELVLLHQELALSFDHCGEIFSLEALNSLLTFTEELSKKSELVTISPCYVGDCLLSIFRKGHVVFKFLADPKILQTGNLTLLDGFTARAEAYLQTRQVAIPRPHVGQVVLSASEPQGRLLQQWKSLQRDGAWIDTPVGVGLERWFGVPLMARLPDVQNLSEEAKTSVPGMPPTLCPIQGERFDKPPIYALQCLGWSSDG